MDRMQERLDALEQQMHAVNRRLRWWRGLAGSLLVLVVLTWALPAGTAQEEGSKGGQRGLAQRVAALEKLLKHFSRDGNEVFITGANLHLVNGLGQTACGSEEEPVPDCPNELGNLIVGYNELRKDDPFCKSVPTDPFCTDTRTGSHNVVVGQKHNFSRFGGLVVGDSNTISGDFAVVSGGGLNTASGVFAWVGGGGSNPLTGQGARNIASGSLSSVLGGSGNTASGDLSSVTAGNDNTASGDFAVVSGGGGNTASGNVSTISGGQGNLTSGPAASLYGGFGNTASGTLSSISGGAENTAIGNFSSVSGGRGNTASGDFSSVSGGQNRTAAGEFDWVAGSLVEDD